MGNEQYRRILAMNGLGEPDGAILLRLLDRRSNAGCPVSDLDRMFDNDRLLPAALHRLWHDGLIRRGGHISLTDTGEDVAGDLLRAKKRPNMPNRTAAMASEEDAIILRTDENLRSVFG